MSSVETDYAAQVRDTLAIVFVLGALLSPVLARADPAPTGHFERWPDELVATVENGDRATLAGWAGDARGDLALYGAFGLAWLDGSPGALCDLIPRTDEIETISGTKVATGRVAVMVLADFDSDLAVACLAGVLASDAPKATMIQVIASLEMIARPDALKALHEHVGSARPTAALARGPAQRLEETLRLELVATLNADAAAVEVVVNNDSERAVRVVGHLELHREDVPAGPVHVEPCQTTSVSNVDDDVFPQFNGSDLVALLPGVSVRATCPLDALRATSTLRVVLRPTSDDGRRSMDLWTSEPLRRDVARKTEAPDR